MEKMQTLFTLGRQPKLGIAELECLYGAKAVTPFGTHAAIVVAAPHNIPFSRLGGSTRMTKVLTKLPSTSWQDIRTYLLETMPKHEQYVPEGKLTIGLSVIGLNIHIKEIERCLLEAKKNIKKLGRSVRIVPNKMAELNAAQIIHNGLTGTNGWELVVISDGKAAYLAQTTHIQDIEAYSARDQARPYRDARVGMLPPKLAQVIINLATGPAEKALVLDPFCGTGVVLQEATLMEYDCYGTDIEPRMVEYSTGNLHWLREKMPEVGDYVRIELGDATSHHWEKQIDAVACETYLGHAYTTLPSMEVLNKNVSYVSDLHHAFLKNIARQLKKGTRLCLGVPAWRTKHGFLHLPVLDHLQELGYNQVKFIHVSRQDLIYHRENQVVARELVVIEKD